MAEDADIVTVREAAQRTGVTRARMHSWIRRGALPVQQGPYGYLVSCSAVRALATASVPWQPRQRSGPAFRDIDGDTAEYVPPSVAARLTGAPPSSVSYWSRIGKVASRPGPYGRLVRL